MITKTITLHLRSKWYHAIVYGDKHTEYRKNTGYWRTRLEGKEYKRARIMLGYDPAMSVVFEVLKIELTQEHNDLNLPECWAIRLGKKISDR